MAHVHLALMEVQRVLNAPKSNYNSFGKYYYRSAEDIVEAAKPLCIKNRILLTLSDEIIQVASRVYVKATASVSDIETGEKVEVTAFAREPDTKKGMDDSQITGTASSYARKYALNGLFAIDDSKDADSEEHAKETSAAKSIVRCACCGNEVVGNDKMSVQTIIDRSKSRYNKIMCYDCCVAQKNGGN